MVGSLVSMVSAFCTNANITSSSISLKAMTARSFSKGIDFLEQLSEACVIVFKFLCKFAFSASVFVALSAHGSKLFLQLFDAPSLSPVRTN